MHFNPQQLFVFVLYATGGDVLMTIDAIWAACLTWNNADGILKIKNKIDSQPLNFLHVSFKVGAVCVILS